jgi:hypothetical protein
VTATSSSEQVIFAHTVEAVFSRVLGGDVALALRDRIRELKVEIESFTDSHVVFRVTRQA